MAISQTRAAQKAARIAFMRGLTQEQRLMLLADEIAEACPDWVMGGEKFARQIAAKQVETREPGFYSRRRPAQN